MPTNRPAHYARHRPLDLSHRQRQVLDLIRAGQTNAEIARELGITLDGAKYHVSEVLAKLDVHSREAAVLRWNEYGSLGSRLGRAIYGLAPIFSLRWLAPATVIAVAGIAAIIYVAAIRGGGEDAAAPPTVTGPAPAASPVIVARPPVAVETHETLTIGEVPREAVVYVPAKLSAPKAPAIVYLTAPGMGPQPLRQRFGIGLDTEADRLGFVAVWAEANTTPVPQPGTGAGAGVFVTCCYWNNGLVPWGTQQPPDDIGFFKALLDLLIAKYPVDPDRISFAGNAGGGVMTYRVACELADRIAGFADVGSSHLDNATCPNARPVSMLLMIGAASPLTPIGGGTNPNNGAVVYPAADIVEYWRALDSCTGSPTVTMLTAKTEERRYSACRDSEVSYIVVSDGSNGWPGAPLSGWTGDPDVRGSPIVAEFLIRQSRVGR